MKIGDLVQLKFPTGASRRRAQSHGLPVDDIGMIVMFPWQGDRSDNVWVSWPSKPKHQLVMRRVLDVVT
jgi:hypothetical protein